MLGITDNRVAIRRGQITESYPRMSNPYCFIPPLLVYTSEGYNKGYNSIIINRIEV